MARWWLLLAALLAGSAASAETISGRVVKVADGDTITILVDGREQVRVRLADIDTPERRQPWGTRAKQALAALVAGQSVRVVVVDTDRYGRTVGRVHVGDLDVNRELVR